MVDLKPIKPKNQKSSLLRRSSNYQQLSLLVLVSILVHVLGLFLYVRYQPAKPETVEEETLEPIDFTVIPEAEVETATEEEVRNSPLPVPEPVPESVSEPVPESTPPPVSPPVPESVSEPVPESTPPPVSPPVPEPTPPPVSEPAPDSVATNSPPEPKPEPTLKPANPDGVSNSASDLLGGDYEKTLASGGDAFFSPEALKYNSVLNPEQLKALKGIDLNQYFAALGAKIKPNWNPGFRQDKRTTVLRFNIEKNGQISGLTVVRGSGSQDADRESLEAIQKSAPFAPLPGDFPLDSLEITFSFNIQIY